MTKSKGKSLDGIADTFALLMWEDRTVKQLVEVSGRRRPTICDHVRALHDAGVIYVTAKTDTGARVWARQPGHPFGKEDAKR